MCPMDFRSATVEIYPWGEVRWLHAGETGMDSLSFGEMTINPGSENRQHYHPNCEEVLYLISGELQHHFEGSEDSFTLKAGMSVQVPMGMTHHSRCVSAEPARMLVAYSSAHHQVIEV